MVKLLVEGDWGVSLKFLIPRMGTNVGAAGDPGNSQTEWEAHATLLDHRSLSSVFCTEISLAVGQSSAELKVHLLLALYVGCR